MARVEDRTSPELLTREGQEALRERPGVADLLEANRWLSTLVAGLIPGCITGASLALSGVSAEWSLIAVGAVTGVVVAFLAVASILLGRPVVPELFSGENEPGELLEGVRWETEAAAAHAARRRNLREGATGGYWIEVEVDPGVWAIERRGDRSPREDGDSGGGGWSWDWFGADGGGGGGGGDGGG